MANVDEHGVRTVLEHGDGWKWVFLTTTGALRREFSAMGLEHGEDGYAEIRRQGPGSGYRSLRDPQGRPQFAVLAQGYGKPFPTDAVNREGVKPWEFISRLTGLFEAEGLHLVRGIPPAPFGFARIDGKLTPLNQALDLIRAGSATNDLDLSGIDCRDLPRKISVKGRLDLSHCMNGDDLPDGIRAGGDLLLTRSHITRTPSNLRVRGMLSLGGCGGLVSVSHGLKVGGMLELSGCRLLRELPAGLSVGGTLDLSDCESMESLPEGLRVGGDLWLFKSHTLRALPEDMEVKGTIFDRDDLLRPGSGREQRI